MVHGLETLQRLNDEAIKRAEVNREATTGEGNDLRRITMGLVCALLVMLLLAGAMQYGQWVMDQRGKMQPIAAELVTVQPLYKFGAEVVMQAGFYIGTPGRVVGWDSSTCSYSVATDWVLIELVPEQDLSSRGMQIANEPDLKPDLAAPFADPF